MAEEKIVRGQKAIEKQVDVPLQQAFPMRTDMEWMKIERPARPKPVAGPKGMRLRDLETPETLTVPDRWPYLHDHPRGAIPISEKIPVLAAGYSIFDKVDVWSDNCIDLYEDAIYDRWSSATTIPWDTISPLPEIIEAAIDQLCTELSEQAYLDVQVVSSWFEKVSYGFKEVKNYFATRVFDRSRHVEAFRKRALVNGGGLGIEGPGIYHRSILGAMIFPDLILAMFLRNVWTKAVCEAVAARARTEVDRALFGLVAKDLGRFNQYVVGYLQHTLAHKPERATALNGTCSRNELNFAAELPRDTSFTEALALTLSDDPTEGLALVEETRRAFLQSYVDLLAEGGLTGRADKLHAKLKEILEPAAVEA